MDDEPSIKNVFTNMINDYLMPKSLQEALNINFYDWTMDPDDHIETMDTLLSF